MNDLSHLTRISAHGAMAILLAGAALLLGVTGVARADGPFSAGPNLAGGGRGEPAVVTLANGDVLLTGGYTSTATLASIERYEVAGGRFSPGRVDLLARGNHAAVRLNDGRVLVTGGYNASGTMATATVYDPINDSWSPAGNMTIDRGNHRATLLADGRVLITGGSTGGVAGSDGTPTATAEIFDPATGTFRATGSMTGTRAAHFVVLLRDGRVLVGLQTVDLFDPATGVFTRTGSLNTYRQFATSTLLPDGRVLVTGGVVYTSAETRSVNQTAEIFDPATRSFQVAGNMTEPRMKHTATLLPNGQVLLTGGFAVNFAPNVGAASPASSTTEVFDPASSTFSAAGSMSTPRGGHVAALLPNGAVLIVGGRDVVGGDVTPKFSATTDIYTPPPSPRFVGTPIFGAAGQAFAVFSGGSPAGAEAAAKAAGATGIWAQDAKGAYVLLVVGGPPFLNQPFRTTFASGFPVNTPLTLTH